MIDALSEIQKEVLRQNEKWGEQNHTMIEWQGILMEEVGEAAKEAVDFHFQNKKDNYLNNPRFDSPESAIIAFQQLQETRKVNYRNELIQIAAVVVQMINCLDRNGQ